MLLSRAIRASTWSAPVSQKRLLRSSVCFKAALTHTIAKTEGSPASHPGRRSLSCLRKVYRWYKEESTLKATKESATAASRHRTAHQIESRTSILRSTFCESSEAEFRA